MIRNRRVVALCTSRADEISAHEFVTTLGNLLRTNNGILLVYNTCSNFFWDPDSAKASVFSLIDYRTTDAVVIMAEEIKNEIVTKRLAEDARKHNVPVIIADGRLDGYVNVHFDFIKGFEKTVRHMVEEHGYRDLHMMAGMRDNAFSEERIEVFRNVLEENGIPFSKETMVSYGDFWSGPTYEAMEKLHSEGRVPRAIVSANDLMAIAINNFLQNNGYKVPEDVAVIGFDGIEDIYFSEPQITSCLCSFAEMAKHTYEVIEKCISEHILEEEYPVHPVLIPGSTCGCKHSKKIGISSYIMELNRRYNLFYDDNRTISEIMANLQNSSNIEQASEALKNGRIYDMVTLINRSCTDSTIDPLSPMAGKPFEEDLLVLANADNHEFKPYEMAREEIIPNFEDIIDRGYPLIFNAIDYMGVPMGYTCFHYLNYDIVNYARIPQIVYPLKIAIGGYVTMQYQKHLQKRVELMYRIDPLTGLYNRMGFSSEYEKLCVNLKNSGECITALLSDLDGLKQINDCYGHSAGDNAIRIAAEALRYACPANALCVRFGGDEMMAVVPGECNEADIRNRFADFFNQYNEKSHLPYRIEASLGIYRAGGNDDTDFESLLKNSDRLMYIEKSAKKKARGEEVR